MSKELKFDRDRFDQGDMPTRTRDGRKVVKVMDSGLGVQYPIVAWLERMEGWYSYSRDGKYAGSISSNRYDLVHEPNTRKVRVMLYWIYPHKEEEQCVCSSNPNYERWKQDFIAKGRFIKEIEVEVDV